MFKDFKVRENDPEVNDVCSVCGKQIEVGDYVKLVETSQRRGNIEFNVDYLPVHSACH